jgi:glycosyltransferase involved in cell wall biosynthesis
VIVPVLDEAPYIDACLTSLHEQRFGRERFEILLVDNGSTDGTLERLSHWPDVTVLHEPTRDPYAARNRGIEAAQGRILAFTDGDCRVAPDWLERLEHAFRETATAIVIGRLAYPPGSSFWLDRYADYYDTKSRWLSETPVPECFYGHGGNMAVRAEVFQQLGGFSKLPCPGDTELLHRLLAKNPVAGIHYADDVVVTHLEIQTLRDMLPKLRRYGQYTAVMQQSPSFRALSTGERLGLIRRCARDLGYGPLRLAALLVALALAAASFESGRTAARRSRP